MSDFRKSLYINIGIIAIVTAVFTGFFILLSLNIGHQTNIIDDIKSRRTNISQLSDNLSSLVKEWALAKDYDQQVESLVPSKDSLVTFSKNINAIAQKDGVSLSFSFGNETDPTSAGTLGSIGLSAVIDGPVSNIVKFLTDLENKYYSLEINTLEMTSPSAAIASLSINGQLFFSGS